MEEKLNQSAGNTSFDNGLNLLVGAVGKVRNGPAGIDENFVI